MPNDRSLSATEKNEIFIKKEIQYLQRQFPWKSLEEIASVFAENGSIDWAKLKKITRLHFSNNAIGYEAQ